MSRLANFGARRAVLSLVLLLVFGAVPAAADDAPAADAWSQWAAGFDGAMVACVRAHEPSCLAKAFNVSPRPALEGVPPDVATDLLRDLRTASVMLGQKDARDALWHGFGIDGSAYLGTGYSVPLSGPGARNYEYARQREYFVPNLCAEAVDPTLCPRPDADIWTWHLTSAQLVQWQDKPLAKLLATLHPQSGAKDFAKRSAHPVAAALPPLLIRFGNLPLASYKGTFGRAGAVRVFFADLGQVRGGTLRGAMVATGAAGLLDKPDPAKTFFIWVYAPGAKSQATVASWKALFDLLAPPAP